MKLRFVRANSSTCWVAGCLMAALLAVSPVDASDWRHFRGPNFDGTATADWPTSPTLKVSWKVPLGHGYSGIAVVDGSVYTAFAAEGSDWLGAFDAESGAELWRLRLGDELPPLGGGHGGPSATPAIGMGLVFAVGGFGSLVAVRPDGEEVWRRELTDWGDASTFGFVSSPILVEDDDFAILLVQAPSRDDKYLFALDPATGKTVWELGGDTATFQSPVVATLDGRKQIIVSGDAALHGLTLRGERLWTFDYQAIDPPSPKGRQVNVPLLIDDHRILIRTHSEEVVAIDVTRAEGCEPSSVDEGCAFKAKTAWTSDLIARTYLPPIYWNGIVFGRKGGVAAALDAASGERLWLSRELGDGFFVSADDRLLVLTKRGGLHIGLASADGWTENSWLQIFGDATWSEPAIADGAIFVRSMGELARVDVVPSAVATSDSEGGGAEGWIDVTQYGADLPDTSFGRFVRSLETVENRMQAVQEFLASVESFPIAEGEWVHFVYRGSDAGAGITGDMVGERAEFEMIRIPGTDLFYFSSKLPRDAIVSYLLFTEDHADGLTDPLNPRATVLPREGSEFDRVVRPYSVVSMPQVEVPTYRLGEPRARGRIETHTLDLSDLGVTVQPPPPMRQFLPDLSPDEQRIRVYLPPGYDAGRSEPYPLVFVFAGEKVLEGLDAQRTLDHLLGDELPAAVVVFVDRHFDFIESDASWAFEFHRRSLFERILPLLQETYHVDAEMYYLGFGFGGPIVIRTAQASESTASRIAAVQPFVLNITRPRLVAGLADVPAAARPSVYLETSRIDFRASFEDWNIAEEHQKLIKDFHSAGWQDVSMVTNSCGFFWEAWTDRLGPALAFLLTGKAEVPDGD